MSKSSPPLHQVPSFKSGVRIKVPLYNRCPHQHPPIYQVSSSESPFTSGVPVRVPHYSRFPPLHQVSQ
ncbi:hypothetical protein AB205_0053780 [Aquarana catesbeiana]|uniref:Uncharacterized protein n=1 Tax=Aquarana catesbeiana TaxID=8400 RepID=A0A2G9RP56_AQUCT|nr:hypothetical protein AB205_0053780 [Aquarana catesbeiana]